MDELIKLLSDKVPINSTETVFFGFPEFLTAFALLIIVWTTVDEKYNFRVKTAPLPLKGLSFVIISFIGLFTLVLDVLRAKEYCIPKVIENTYILQGLLGALLFATFILWVWFSFVTLPKYGKLNAKRFVRTLYKYILKGKTTELAAISEELVRSIPNIIRYSIEKDGIRKTKKKVGIIANDILLLMADKRFCNEIADSVPELALKVFIEIKKTGKYNIPINTFSRNILNSALMNENSFIYNETNGFDCGFLGYVQPITKALYSDYTMVDRINGMLEIDLQKKYKWNENQWNAYARIVLLSLADAVNKGRVDHLYPIYSAINEIQDSTLDIFSINRQENIDWSNGPYSRLRNAVGFINDAIDTIINLDIPKYAKRKISLHDVANETIYDKIARTIFQLILNASSVKEPLNTCWWIQHNTVWSNLIKQYDTNKNRKYIEKKALRLIYDEIIEAKTFPNYQNMSLLSMILNILRFNPRRDGRLIHIAAFHSAVIQWTKHNLLKIYKENAHIVDSCFVQGMKINIRKKQLIRENLMDKISKKHHIDILQLE